jgi:hypothetical protein
MFKNDWRKVIMKFNFQAAYQYLEKTSPNDIFIRNMPYIVYTTSVINKPITRNATLTILAALAGPFDIKTFEEPEIKEYLELRKFDKSKDWFIYIDQWAEKYMNGYRDGDYYKKMWDIIIQKDPQIINLVNNHKLKHYGYYIPELVALGFQNDHWPRK